MGGRSINQARVEASTKHEWKQDVPSKYGSDIYQARVVATSTKQGNYPELPQRGNRGL